MPLSLERVGKRYGRGRTWILDDVSLELAPGTINTVVGVNGSGKSTLLRVIVGASNPSRGAVRNRPSRVAFVPDRFIPPRMTARAYLDHIGRLRRLGSAERRKRSAELDELLAIVPGLDAPLATLSRGNAKKVALAQAFIAPVDLIALDEPRAALDEPAQAILQALIAGACDRGAAVVVADHATMPEARSYVLVDGRLEPMADGHASPAHDHVRVTLRPKHRDAPLAPLYALAVSAPAAPASGCTTSLVVPAEQSDAFLEVALSNGWSPCELRPLADGG